MGYRIGIDVGGTFTDFVAANTDQQVYSGKTRRLPLMKQPASLADWSRLRPILASPFRRSWPRLIPLFLARPL